MKLSILFISIPSVMAMVGLSSVRLWLADSQQSVMNFIDNPFRKSTIPQFILDTRHPWILANQRKLERLPSAQAFLCSDPYPESKELTPRDDDKTGEHLELPHDLFKCLKIDNTRYGTSRAGWPNAILRLREMKECPRALEQAKCLHVDIYVHDHKYSDWYLKALELPQPTEELLDLFGDVLESMTSLETMRWGISKEATHHFEDAFKARNLTLPSVKNLEPGPFSHYLVEMCPNLERLENGGGNDWYHAYMPDREDCGRLLIQAAASTPRLKHFAMIAGDQFRGWDPELVAEVIRYMPQIESLRLSGTLGRDGGYGSELEKTGKLEAITEALQGLENLTHLDLPAAYALGLGFQGGGGCGNAYMGKSGRAWGRYVAKRGAEKTEEAALIVLDNLPHLQSFSIGGQRPNMTKTDEGTVDMSWPWTGRMQDWLMERWPEPDGEEPWDMDTDYNKMDNVVVLGDIEMGSDIMGEEDLDFE